MRLGPMTSTSNDGAPAAPPLAPQKAEKPRMHNTLLYCGCSGTSAWHACYCGGLLLKSRRAASHWPGLRAEISPIPFFLIEMPKSAARAMQAQLGTVVNCLLPHSARCRCYGTDVTYSTDCGLWRESNPDTGTCFPPSRRCLAPAVLRTGCRWSAEERRS